MKKILNTALGCVFLLLLTVGFGPQAWAQAQPVINVVSVDDGLLVIEGKALGMPGDTVSLGNAGGWFEELSVTVVSSRLLEAVLTARPPGTYKLIILRPGRPVKWAGIDVALGAQGPEGPVGPPGADGAAGPPGPPWPFRHPNAAVVPSG